MLTCFLAPETKWLKQQALLSVWNSATDPYPGPYSLPQLMLCQLSDIGQSAGSHGEPNMSCQSCSSPSALAYATPETRAYGSHAFCQQLCLEQNQLEEHFRHPALGNILLVLTQGSALV